MSKIIYQNFYIKSPVEMLDIPLPLEAFLKPADNTDTERYYTINEYLASINQTIERWTNDGVYFLKGFGFDIDSLDELRLLLPDYGLEEKVNFFIVSPGQVGVELAKPEWNSDELV